MFHIRLGNHHKERYHTQALLKEIRNHPGCCDAVWFASEYGYPPLSRHQEAAKSMEKLALLYRAEGIQVDLQISNTIGHGDHMKNRDCSAVDMHNFERMVGHDGTTAGYSFCWYGESFRDYIFKEVQAYSKIHPENVWIDDDLRALNHAPVDYGCFCDKCIERFNSMYNTNFSREELVDQISNGDTIWRERHIAFLQEGLSSFAEWIAKAVMSVSPESKVGIQYGLDNLYLGGTYNPVFKRLEQVTRHPTVSRAGGGAYDDKTPYNLLAKQIQLSYATAKLPDTVELIVPEIENEPDVAFGKTTYGTLLESSIALAYGHTGLSYATLMTTYEPLNYHVKLLEGLSKNRAYWEKMIECNKRTVFSGLGIAPAGYKHIKSSTQAIPYAELPGILGTQLTKLGFAEHHDSNHAQVLCLNNAILDTLTNEELSLLLDRPVITDATVIESMIARGFGADLGIEVCAVQNVSCREKFQNGNGYILSIYDGVTHLPPMILKGPSEALGILTNSVTGEELGVANGIITLPKAKWAVFGYGLWHDIVSSDKRNQIINAIDSISEHKMPAILLDAEQVTVIPRTTPNGKTVMVSLLNISIGDTDALHLLIRNPDGQKFVYQNGSFCVKLIPERIGSDWYVTLPGFKKGWDLATLFISN